MWQEESGNKEGPGDVLGSKEDMWEVGHIFLVRKKRLEMTPGLLFLHGDKKMILQGNPSICCRSITLRKSSFLCSLIPHIGKYVDDYLGEKKRNYFCINTIFG